MLCSACGAAGVVVVLVAVEEEGERRVEDVAMVLEIRNFGLI